MCLPLRTMRRLRDLRGVALVGILTALQITNRTAGAQGPRTRTIGLVVDSTGTGIPAASIGICGGSTLATTGRDGVFVIALSPRSAEYCIRRIGYREVRIAAHANALAIGDTLRVRMAVASAELRGLVISGDRNAVMTATLTTETVRQAPPLAEADVFRTLTLLPEVLQVNDLSARVHLAGGASDEHAITLDGHPLQSPYHAATTIGAFNVAALERADLRVHHLPSDREGSLSGEIALETLRPRTKPQNEVVLSLLSVSGTTARPLPGQFDLLLSARTSFLDKVLAEYVRSSGSRQDDLVLPGFSDVLLRLGRQSRSGWGGEALAYLTRDSDKELNQRAGELPVQWGERLFGFKVGYTGQAWSMMASASNSLAVAERRELLAGATQDSVILDDSRVVQDWSQASISVQRHLQRWQLRAGAGVLARRHTHRWTERFAQRLLPGSPLTEADTSTSQTRRWIFAEAVRELGSRTMITAGVNASALQSGTTLAPRFSLSRTLSGSLHMVASANRRHQFDAIAGEPREGSVTPPTFLLPRARVSDMVALTAGWKPGASALSVDVTGFVRRNRDRTVAVEMDDQRGSIEGGARFVRNEGRVVGAQVSANASSESGHHLQLSYTSQSTTEEIDGRSLPTSWDAPHQLSVFTSVPIRGAWRLNVATQARSGTAVTPVKSRTFVPLLDNNRYLTRFVYGEARSARLPAYARFDIGTQYRRMANGAEWVFSLQVANATARMNGIEYDWRTYFACVGPSSPCSSQTAKRRGLPIVPSVGVSVRW